MFYRLQSAVTLPGPVGGWDYLAFDPARNYLFLDRRAQGVTVYDVDSRKVVAQIANSTGANSTAFAPDLNLGFTSNGDGSTTIFRLSSLKTIKRVRFGKSADAGFYEPTTRQMLFAMGDDHAVAFLDARTGKLVSVLQTKSRKLEAAVADGHGKLFMNERDRNSVLRIDPLRHVVTAEWPVVGCDEPTGIAYDAADARLFIGCRGDHPVLSVMNAKTGAVVTTIPIGRGNDSVIYDPSERRIYTSNGIDANIVAIKQLDADRYALAEATTTRPEARTMAFDPKSKRIFVVTAQGAVDPARKIDTAVSPFYPNRYFRGTYTILTYARR
ncbi:MAG: YncE family protein [Alphaproteobacteria bacterium]|nr:YncE family protein [Alphaproteobacteria bacterium]